MEQDGNYTTNQTTQYSATNNQESANYSSNSFINEKLNMPLTTAQFLGAMFIGIIPIAGIIIYIVWALSNDININKRNFARSSLIFFLITQVALGILLFLFIVLLVVFADPSIYDTAVLM